MCSMAKDWEKARAHFLKVLTLAPTFDQAKRYADQAATEMAARDALQRAKNSLGATCVWGDADLRCAASADLHVEGGFTLRAQIMRFCRSEKHSKNRVSGPLSGVGTCLRSAGVSFLHEREVRSVER